MDNQPTLEQWRKLYALAEQVKQLQPWQWMEEADIFGVELPDTGEMGFVSVMGMGGEHYAVSIYRGMGALFLLWDFMAMGPYASPLDLLQIPQVMIAYGSRKDSTSEDHAIYKQLKLKFRGPHDWVTFRDYSPGFLPWFMTARDVPLVIAALEQLLDVAPRYKANVKVLFPEAPDDYFEVRAQTIAMEKEEAKQLTDPSFSFPFGDFDPAELMDDPFWGEDDDWDEEAEAEVDLPEAEVMIRVSKREGDALTWQDTYRKLSVANAPVREIQVQADPGLLEGVKRLPKMKNPLQLDLAMMPMPVEDPGERPYFPYMLLGVDAKSGLILFQETLKPQPDIAVMYQQLPDLLLTALKKFGKSPRQISVMQPLLANLLAGLAQTLKSKISLEAELPALEAAQDAAMPGSNFNPLELVKDLRIDDDELNNLMNLLGRLK